MSVVVTPTVVTWQWVGYTSGAPMRLVPESQYAAALAEVARLTVDLTACEQELVEAQKEADDLERDRDKAIELAFAATAACALALELIDS